MILRPNFKSYLNWSLGRVVYSYLQKSGKKQNDGSNQY